jgi:hypothetical protein
MKHFAAVFSLDQQGPIHIAPPAMNLETACAEDLIALYKRMWTECGYKASNLIKAMNVHGALATVRGLINSPVPSNGFVAMLLRRRLDLSVEAIAVGAAWNHALTTAELDKAYSRLDECGYREAPAAA